MLAGKQKSGNSEVFAGGGEVGRLMSTLDWPATALGDVAAWPQSLRTAVSICLASRFPIVIYWGPEYITLYNDAYSEILAKKHPWALGRSAREVWAEIWSVIGPMLDNVTSTAQATWSDDLLLVLERRGYAEECYFSFSFSPVRVEGGGVGGVFTAVAETTGRVLGERRLSTLRDLAARVAQAKTAPDACAIAAATMAANNADIPFALIYLLDAGGEIASLAGCAGLAPDTVATPRVLAIRDQTAPGWPVAQVIDANRSAVVRSLPSQFGRLPGGPWPEPVDSALILPIASPAQKQLAGFLIAGISPRRELNAEYRSFFELTAGHVATAVANARAYEDERRRAEALAEVDRAKTAFFSNISHELRTPLTLILGPLEDILGQMDGPNPSARAELELVHHNASRLLKLVNALLDFVRIEAGRVQASYQPVDLASLTAGLASVFRSAIEKAGVRLAIDCAPLPEPVCVDRDMWEKIVLNLLSNAFKFTFTGEITVALKNVDGRAELSVRDTGVGIPPDDLALVFDRFHRVEGARGRTMEGSGIGLALVQELVKLHGGSVRVESELGRGSTFTVSIPFGRDHLPAGVMAEGQPYAPAIVGASTYVEEALRWLPGVSRQPADMPELPPIAPASIPAEQRVRVLVADDNSDMRDYIRRLLSHLYEVETAPDGMAALEALRTRRFDLVLTDVMMPHLDGFGLLREIRNNPPIGDIPVMLLSARAGEEARIDGLRAGADDYLVKPFSSRELVARVSSRIEVARLRREATARERELRELAEAEHHRWRGLLAQAPAMIAVLSGPNHIFDLANPEYLQAAGRQNNPASILGKPIREALPELEGQIFFDLLDEVFRTGQPYVGNEQLAKLDYHGDGILEDRYFNFVYQAIRNVGGEIQGILVHAVDVTDQVLSRRRVEESERQLRTLADSMPQLVWMAEPDGHVFWYNRRWFEYTGATADRMIGWGWQSVHDPAILPQVLDRWRASIHTGEPFEMEFPLRGANGEFRRFLTRVTPVRDEFGSIYRWYGTNTDIEDQKRAEETIRLKQRLESTGLLAGGIAHDFNNLLTGVLGGASLVLETTAVDDPNAPLLQAIVDSAERAAHLTRQMLAYAGKGSFIIRRLSLSEQVREIIGLLHAAIPKKVALQMELSDNRSFIEADPSQIQQVVMNLILNAAEAIGEERSGVVKINTRCEHIAASAAGDFIPEKLAPGYYDVFEVQDDGAGMPADLVPRIFDPFFTTKFTGRGLGLSAVIGIMHSYRGALTVQSAPGRGSTFRAYFPVAAVADEPVEAPAIPRRIPGHGLVLVVDDEEIVRRTAQYALEQHGYSVALASNGRIAVEIFRQRGAEIGAVLLDLTMPVMDGSETITHLKQIAPNVPVVLSSGYDEREATRRFSGSGLAGFIQKPYIASKLVSILDDVLNRSLTENSTR
jgi:PAS domain S-box-containing protein